MKQLCSASNVFSRELIVNAAGPVSSSANLSRPSNQANPVTFSNLVRMLDASQLVEVSIFQPKNRREWKMKTRELRDTEHTF